MRWVWVRQSKPFPCWPILPVKRTTGGLTLLLCRPLLCSTGRWNSKNGAQPSKFSHTMVHRRKEKWRDKVTLYCSLNVHYNSFELKISVVRIWRNRQFHRSTALMFLKSLVRMLVSEQNYTDYIVYWNLNWYMMCNFRLPNLYIWFYYYYTPM